MVQTAKAPKVPKPGTQASKADRHRCYEEAVQCVESEIDFVDANYKRIRGKRASVLREDFCGSAAVAAAFVDVDAERRALGVDHDPGALEAARALNPRERVELLEADARTPGPFSVDVVCAENFSYATDIGLVLTRLDLTIRS